MGDVDAILQKLKYSFVDVCFVRVYNSSFRYIFLHSACHFVTCLTSTFPQRCHSVPMNNNKFISLLAVIQSEMDT